MTVSDQRTAVLYSVTICWS